MTVNGSGNASSAMTSIDGVRCDALEGFVDQPLDEGPQSLDHLGGERPLDETTDAGVIGRVEAEQRTGPGRRPAADDHLDALEQRLFADGITAGDADGGVAQHPHDVFVAEEEPRPERHLLDRLALALRSIGRIRVVEEAGTEEAADLGRRHRRSRTIGITILSVSRYQWYVKR